MSIKKEIEAILHPERIQEVKPVVVHEPRVKGESDLEKYIIRLALINYIRTWKKNAKNGSKKAQEEIAICNTLLEGKYNVSV